MPGARSEPGSWAHAHAKIVDADHAKLNVVFSIFLQSRSQPASGEVTASSWKAPTHVPHRPADHRFAYAQPSVDTRSAAHRTLDLSPPLRRRLLAHQPAAGVSPWYRSISTDRKAAVKRILYQSELLDASPHRPVSPTLRAWRSPEEPIRSTSRRAPQRRRPDATLRRSRGVAFPFLPCGHLRPRRKRGLPDVPIAATY